MAEDADRPDTTTREEAESKPKEVEKQAEEASLADRAKSKIPTISRKGILGRIFNIRMLRRIVQIGFLLAINAYILVTWFGDEAVVTFWEQFREVLPTLPIIAPLEAPYAVIAGSFDALQREFTSGVFPFFTIGAAVIILIVLGRSACAWVCPIGTIQDFATLPNRHKIRPSPNTEVEMRRIKAYVFFIVMFLVVWVATSYLTGQVSTLVNALGMFFDAAFDPFNPAYILFVVVPGLEWPQSWETLWYLTGFGYVAWLQIMFLIAVFVVSFWIPRWFCRWLCPAGWFYGVFSRNSLIGIGRNPARCTPDTCNICETVCPMNIRIRRFPYKHMYTSDCIMCLECKSHCPNRAITVRFS